MRRLIIICFVVGQIIDAWKVSYLLFPENALQGFNIVVVHVKPPQKNIEKIKVQLKVENRLHLNLIFPEQGKAINL